MASLDYYDADTLDTIRRNPLQTALVPAALQDFRISKIFKDNGSLVSSLDYSLDGTQCITTSRDESLRIYDSMRGTRAQVLFSKKYGCNLAQFTNQLGYVAYASTKINDTIRYLSIETNQYIRYFVGHSGLVTSLQRTPKGDGLLSVGMDGCLCIWDLESVNPINTLKVGEKDCGLMASFDPSGMVVAVAGGSEDIKLFDVREINRGPFRSWEINKSFKSDVSPLVARIQFIPPLGDLLLVSMTDGSSQIWNSHSGDHIATLSGIDANDMYRSMASSGVSVSDRMQAAYLGQNITISPDGKCVLAGCADGRVVYWDISRLPMNLSNGYTHQMVPPSGSWKNDLQDGALSVCAFNPYIMECVTASNSLAFWTLQD